MTSEERRARMIAILKEKDQHPTGRDPATRMAMNEKLMQELVLLGLSEVLDFAANVEWIATSLNRIAEAQTSLAMGDPEAPDNDDDDIKF